MFSKTKKLFSLIGLSLTAAACAGGSPKAAKTVQGSLSCAGGYVRSAGDAARFVGCTSIAGDLGIEDAGLRHLDALSALQRVSGTLSIADNGALQDLSGLAGLRSVGALDVRNNPRLKSLEGLAGLRTSRIVSITGNPRLESLEGLERLSRVESLVIAENGLHTTAGLERLSEVEALVIEKNPRLISLGGFAGLERVGTLRVSQNPRICAKLGLFEGLQRVEGSFSIVGNAGLTARDVERLRERTGPVADPRAEKLLSQVGPR